MPEKRAATLEEKPGREVGSPRSPAREPLVQPGALLNAVGLALLAGLLVGIWILFAEGGWDYYTTPLGVRGYAEQHRQLRPSGSLGHTLGIAGTLVMSLTLIYVARKRMRRFSKKGPTRRWLEFHIFCGVFGPILITLHSSFKFNGIVSVAYWSMVLVVVSGFLGRHLYVRIPKTIRGHELSRIEIEDRTRELQQRLSDNRFPSHLVLRIEAVESEIMPRAGEDETLLQSIRSGLTARRKMRGLRKEIRSAGLSRQLLDEATEVAGQRATLYRRMANLKRTRKLFQLWHVFHQPLVWVMFLIFSIHLGVAVYFGYAVLGW